MSPSPPAGTVVSIILPTYNRAGFLDRALRSILTQTFPNWEALVVDDGSTDDTPQQVGRIGDPRVRYIRQPRNRGVSAARNLGLRLSRGRLVTFLDSDDEYLPVKLERQVAVLAAAPAEVGAVECGLRIVANGTHRDQPPQLRGQDYLTFLRCREGVNMAALLVRADLARMVGFDEGLTAREDVDFMARLLCQTSLAFIDDPLVVIHNDAPIRLSAGTVLLRGLEQLARKYDHEQRASQALRVDWNHRLALAYLQQGRIRDARQALARAIAARPLDVVHWGLYLTTLLGRPGAALAHRVYLAGGRLKQRLRG